MSNYRVMIDDVNVTTKLVGDGFRVILGEMTTTRASVRLYEQAYSIGSVLQIYYDDTLIFQGDIDKEGMETGVYIAYSSNKLMILGDKAASNENHRLYESAEYSTIVTDLLSYYLAGEFDVTEVDVTGKTAVYLDLTSKPLNECLKICAQRARFTFWLVSPDKLYFKAIDTVSSGYTAIYGTNIEKIKITRDNFTKTKVVVVFTVNNVKASIERGTGSRIVLLTDDTINNSNDANDLGDAILDELQDIQIRGTIELVEPRHDLIPGTTIIVHAPKYGLSNATVRIKEVSYTSKKTRITIGRVGAMVEQTLVSYEERIKKLEDRGIDWILSCTSPMQTAAGCDGPCEVKCEATCEVTCQSGDCQAGICQSNCQLVEQISCVTTEQICGTVGTCQVACELGHKCETDCQAACQNYCQTGQCQVGCETACEIGCEITCQDACQDACQVACETTPCQTTCQSTCQSTCQVPCYQVACEISCQGGCQTGCKVGCEVEDLCCGTIGPY